MISANLSSKQSKSLDVCRMKEIKSWKNYSEDKLNCILSHRLRQFRTQSDLNKYADGLSLKLKQAVNELTETKISQSRNTIPWFSENLKLLKQEKMRSVMKIMNSDVTWEATGKLEIYINNR